MSAGELLPGHVYFDVVSPERGRPNLCIGDDNTGYRISGPKAWGGGKTLYRFDVSISELRQIIEEYENTRTPPKEAENGSV